MADIRINALATTAASTASDDFVAVDGSANGTRKLNAYSPTFGGNLTVSGGTTTLADSNGSFGTITGSYNAGNPFVRFNRIGGTEHIGFFADNSTRFVNNNAEKARITSTGNFLLGTTIDGGQKLQVSGTGTFSNTTASTPTIQLNSNQTTTGLSFLSTIGGAPASERNWAILTNAVAYGDFVIRVSNAQGGNPITAGTTALTLDSSQNATFAGTVSVSNTITTTGSNAALFFNSRTGANSNYAWYSPDGTVARLYDNTNAKTLVDVAANTGNATFAGTITTAAPTSGTAKAWKLGEVATVSPTSPNRTIRVEIDGTVYYISAKTTND